MSIISIIVPFLNEESCITQYCEFIDDFSRDKPFETEIIFVDDGSTDNTVDVISQYRFQYCNKISIVILSKNHGAHAAIRAGIFHASGDYITYVGADLQEPDDMVTEMYDTIIRGFDAVYVEKNSIQVSRGSRLFSLVYAWLMRKYAVKNFGSGGINNIMFNSKIKDFLNQNIESNSSIMLQIIDAGYKNATLPMDYKNRVAGTSKWTLSKKIKLFVDSFVAFSFAPIRMVSIVGVLMFFFGALFLVGIVVSRIIYSYTPVGYPTLAAIMVMGFGITNISLGIISEYLWRALDAARKRPTFLVSEIKELNKCL